MVSTPPKLICSPTVQLRLSDVDALSTLYSLLANPDIDGRVKFSLEGFPYGPGTRALIDDSWHVVYSVDDDRNVHAHTMYTQKEIDDIGHSIGA